MVDPKYTALVWTAPTFILFYIPYVCIVGYDVATHHQTPHIVRHKTVFFPWFAGVWYNIHLS